MESLQPTDRIALRPRRDCQFDDLETVSKLDSLAASGATVDCVKGGRRLLERSVAIVDGERTRFHLTGQRRKSTTEPHQFLFQLALQRVLGCSQRRVESVLELHAVAADQLDRSAEPAAALEPDSLVQSSQPALAEVALAEVAR